MVGTKFQFPSNGKAYPKKPSPKPLCSQKSFNSLQTGKRIQSNYVPPYSVGGTYQVSIPFKRESVSKVLTKINFSLLTTSFNSLQTGKRIQSEQHQIQLELHRVSIPFKRESVSKDEALLDRLRVGSGFNSLQTGKRIQRGGKHKMTIKIKVSIPFKRESVSKEEIKK